MSTPRPLAAMLVVSLLAACKPAASAEARHASVLIRGVPLVSQKPDFCGEACAAMALRRLGHPHTQDDVFAATGVDPGLGRGAVTRELARGLKGIGFQVGQVWHTVRRARAAAELGAQFKALHADLRAGVPSIVCTHYDESRDTTEHFRLVVGYDARSDEVIYNDPAETNGAYLKMPRRRFLALWPLKYKRQLWTVIRIPLRPGRIQPPDRRAHDPHTPAGYAQHVRRLKQRIKRKGLRGFTVVIQPPFVVLGDEGRGAVGRRARGTVKWAVDLLKQDYFPKNPQRIIDIFLFKDRASYITNTVRLTGHRPGTPFGFYSEAQQALIMNIATGGGTLVHEIVHPFVEANFPKAPPWFNEGLGSLYEACGQHDGKIYGYTNWRLPGLQEAIRNGALPSFRTLMAANSHQFYERDPGTNYGQARYLAYYLQEKGLLRTYYRRFLSDHRRDPSGYETLKQVLGVRDMGAFQREWEAYVLRLRWRQ